MRLLRSGLEREEVEARKRDLIPALFSRIPTGVGSHGAYDLNAREEDEVYSRGAQWAVSKGMGLHEDLQHIEENGCFPNAEPSEVSDRAKKRGRPQLGTLGSGNHFLEIQYVEEIYDDPAANQIGLFKNQVVVLIHTGSRGFGHQICDDSIQAMLRASQKYGIQLADRQLCCAPIRSAEGQSYLQAMACGVNYAFANRQLITHGVREVFREFFDKSEKDIALSVVYDVCHNIAKMERHKVGSVEKEYCVHRKGATRAFAPGHPKVPQDYRKIGQPVLIPGDMGRYSYVLVGTEGAMGEAFGSTCHGAGRQMSRTKAKQVARGRNIEHELEGRGVVAHSATRAGLAEEISEAYKDVADVVDVVHRAGLSRKVARLRPMAVIKG